MPSMPRPRRIILSRRAGLRLSCLVDVGHSARRAGALKSRSLDAVDQVSLPFSLSLCMSVFLSLSLFIMIIVIIIIIMWFKNTLSHSHMESEESQVWESRVTEGRREYT